MFTQMKEEAGMMESNKAAIIAFCAGIVLVVGGIAWAYLYEGWQFLTSIYVITQIVTTVGYGDVTVSDTDTKLFFSFYIMAQMVLFSYYLNLFAQKLSAAQESRAEIRIRQLCSNKIPSWWNLSDEALQLVRAGIYFGLAVAFGTIFYANYEACTCSYGTSYVEGCKETTLKQCQETGGYQKDYATSFYMSIVTLLTIGFGDHTPRSYVGRAVGVVWMLVGVTVTANFVSAISEFCFATKALNDFLKALDIDEHNFKKIDSDGSGSLNRGEFLTFALQQYGLVQPDILQELNSLYDKLDSADGNSDGGVSFKDIMAINKCCKEKKQQEV